MRWTVICGTLLAGVFIVWLGATLSHGVGGSKVASSDPANQAASPSNRVAAGEHRSIPRNPSSAPAVVFDPEADAQKQIEEIDRAFVDGGDDVGVVVSAKLSHPDKRVRQSAVATLVKLDDRAVIPDLQRALDLAGDPEEKTNIQAAIDFLSLPSYNELVSTGELPPLEANSPEATNSTPTAVPDALLELSRSATNH